MPMVEKYRGKVMKQRYGDEYDFLTSMTKAPAHFAKNWSRNVQCHVLAPPPTSTDYDI